MSGPASDLAARDLIELLGGHEPADQGRAEVIHQLCNRLELLTALSRESAATWQAIRGAPVEHRHEHRQQLTALISGLGARDPVIRSLVTTLGPVAPRRSRIAYQELLLAVEASATGGLQARILASPTGSATCRLEPLGVLVAQRPTAITMQGEREPTIDGAPDRNLAGPRTGPEDVDPAEYGRSLHRWLFSGAVRDCWLRALTHVRERDEGLRLRLAFNLDQAEAATAASLCWECLKDPDDESAVCLSTRTPVVRTLESTQLVTPVPGTRPLRVLLAWACPSSENPLDVRREAQEIGMALRDIAGIEARVVGPVDRDGLRTALTDIEPHILHFMGHGDSEHGRSVLALERPDGSCQTASSQVLANILNDISSLRLLVLNSCKTGMLATGSGVDPFSSMAGAIGRIGLPAILAMQHPISDAAAICFSSSFYRYLATGSAIETAVTEGRKAIHDADPDSTEWMTPALFLRTPPGHRLIEELLSPAR